METRAAAKQKREVSEGVRGLRALTATHARDCVARLPAQYPSPFWFEAAKQGDAKTLQQFAPCVDVNAKKDGGYAALHLAVRSGSLTAVEVLLAAGANPSIATGKYQNQPLHLAAEIGPPRKAVPIIKALLAAGAAPDARDYCGRTPAHDAASYGHVEGLAALLDAGVPVDSGAGTQRGSLLDCACWSRSTNAAQVVRLLLQRGAAVNPGPQPVRSPLHFAASHGSVGVMDLLLEAGAEVDARDERGRTPLMRCSNSDARAPAAARLLAAGADLNAADEYGYTAMHHAADECKPALVRLLAAWGADPLRTNKQGRRPLQLVPSWAHDRFRAIAALVAAGDRDWALVPRPCPGLEGALGAVWRAAPHELPQLVARLEGGALKRLRTALLVLHLLVLRTPLPQPLVMPVLACAFDY